MKFTGIKTLIRKVSATSLILVIFAAVWAVCSRPLPRHQSMMPLWSFSLKGL